MLSSRYRARRWLASCLALAACAGEPSDQVAVDAAPDAALDAGTDAEPDAAPDPEPDCCGCLCADPSWSCSADTCTAGGRVYPLAPEAGFFEIEPDLVLASDLGERARMWYAFWPADSEPEQKPLALFFQGGPYASVSILWGGNTGPHTLDPARTNGEPIAPNPHSWTRFANLLYVDSPYAGFSYFIGQVPGKRVPGYGRSEAAAVVRVLLRFLARHPKLERAPVILVGESYGGIRATLMLRQLLRYAELENADGWYHDPALAAEIRRHLRRTRDAGEQAEFSAAQVAEQFGTQVLIQGAVVEYSRPRDEPGSCSLDATSPACLREELANDAAERSGRMETSLLEPALLGMFAGVDVASIQWLHASERVDAFKLPAPHGSEPDASEFSATFGELSSTDKYYVRFGCPLGCAPDANDDLAERFADNLREVSTFMTDAIHDSTLDTRDVIEKLPDAVDVRSVERRPLGGRVAELVVSFENGSLRKIRFPAYENSGHGVAMFEPDLLARDVESWLRELREQRQP